MNVSLRGGCQATAHGHQALDRTSCVSSSSSSTGEELGVRRAWGRGSQGPRASGCPHLQAVGETEATNPWGGDGWAPPDSKHRKKYSKCGQNPRLEHEGPFPESCKTMVLPQPCTAPCHWQALVTFSVRPLEGCGGNTSPKKLWDPNREAWD